MAMIKQKIKVPNKLAEITLGQYQKFSKIYTKDVTEQIGKIQSLDRFNKMND